MNDAQLMEYLHNAIREIDKTIDCGGVDVDPLDKAISDIKLVICTLKGRKRNAHDRSKGNCQEKSTDRKEEIMVVRWISLRNGDRLIDTDSDGTQRMQVAGRYLHGREIDPEGYNKVHVSPPNYIKVGDVVYFPEDAEDNKSPLYSRTTFYVLKTLSYQIKIAE